MLTAEIAENAEIAERTLQGTPARRDFAALSSGEGEKGKMTCSVDGGLRSFLFDRSYFVRQGLCQLKDKLSQALRGTSLTLLDFGRGRTAGQDFLFSLISFEGKRENLCELMAGHNYGCYIRLGSSIFKWYPQIGSGRGIQGPQRARRGFCGKV